MQAWDLQELRTGQLLTTDEFMVQPADLAAHVESSFLGEVIGCGEECLSSAGSAERGDAGWGRICPVAVVIGRAIAALAGTLTGLRIEVGKVARVSARAPAIVGEPLSAQARVRFARRSGPGLTCVTLEVAVRRRQGEVLRFELAIEARAAAGRDAA